MVNVNMQHHPAISVSPSDDTPASTFKHSQITQLLDTEGEKLRQLKGGGGGEEGAQIAKGSGGLTVDYTKIWDVFRSFIEQVRFRGDLNEEIDV